jgi:glycosyltransferase involved in cell wall biosynthesis
MRLLHILSQRPGRSGSGVFLNAMVREAARRGYEQHVIVGAPPGTTAQEVCLNDDQFSPILFPSNDAPFPVPGNSDVMPYPTSVFSQMTELQIEQYLAASRQVMENVRERFRPQMVHAHHLWLMTALAREVFHDVPMVATSHNAELRQAIKAPHLLEHVFAGIRGLEKIGVLTAQSVTDTVLCFGVAPARIAICGAGFRDDLFHYSGDGVPSLLEAAGGGPFATFVGRLSTPKGVPFLLQAAAQLSERFPGFRVLLVGASGSGYDGQAVDQLVAAAGGRVIHLGTQPQEMVAGILGASALFVLPSLFEGLPLTMLEALACGCPVVVSGLPTIRSWIPQEWREANEVELIEPLQTTRADEPVASDVPRFVTDLAGAIERQLLRRRDEEERRRLAEKMTPHSWSRVFERYETIYRELAGGR